jgi:hypothetical protein
VCGGCTFDDDRLEHLVGAVAAQGGADEVLDSEPIRRVGQFESPFHQIERRRIAQPCHAVGIAIVWADLKLSRVRATGPLAGAEGDLEHRLALVPAYRERQKEVQAQITGRLEVEARHPDVATGGAISSASLRARGAASSGEGGVAGFRSVRHCLLPADTD